MKRDELGHLSWLSKLLLFKVKAQRIDILIGVKDDTPLLPAANMNSQIPLPVRRVCQLSRPLSVASPGEGVSYFVAQSWPFDGESGLAPQYVSIWVLAPGDLTASRSLRISTAVPTDMRVRSITNWCHKSCEPWKRKETHIARRRGKLKGRPTLLITQWLRKKKGNS